MVWLGKGGSCLGGEGGLDNDKLLIGVPAKLWWFGMFGW